MNWKLIFIFLFIVVATACSVIAFDYGTRATFQDVAIFMMMIYTMIGFLLILIIALLLYKAFNTDSE